MGQPCRPRLAAAPPAAQADRIQADGARAGAGHGDVGEILGGGEHELMRGTVEAGRYRAPADRGWRPSLLFPPGVQGAQRLLVVGGPGRVLTVVSAALGRG